MLNVNYLSQYFLRCLTNCSIAVLPLKTEYPTPVHLLWGTGKPQCSLGTASIYTTDNNCQVYCTSHVVFPVALGNQSRIRKPLGPQVSNLGDNLRLTDLHFGWVYCNYSRGRYRIACISVCLCVFTILFHWDISNPRIKQKAASYLFFSITFTKRQRVDLLTY